MFILPLENETDEQYSARVRSAAGLFYGKDESVESRSDDCGRDEGVRRDEEKDSGKA